MIFLVRLTTFLPVFQVFRPVHLVPTQTLCETHLVPFQVFRTTHFPPAYVWRIMPFRRRLIVTFCCACIDKGPFEEIASPINTMEIIITIAKNKLINFFIIFTPFFAVEKKRNLRCFSRHIIKSQNDQSGNCCCAKQQIKRGNFVVDGFAGNHKNHHFDCRADAMKQQQKSKFGGNRN